MDYGNRIKELRKALKKSQDELASMTGISRQSLYRIEKNESEIGIEFLNKIGQQGVNVSWIMTGNGDMFGNSISLSMVNEIDSDDTIYVPLKNYSASAGTGIMNYEEDDDNNLIPISARLLGITPEEAQGGYFLTARGNSMTPKIDNGDRLFVKDITPYPRYLEGLYIVNYDGEVYVKEIQLTENELVMRSINKDYKDIVIPNVEETDIQLNIIAKVWAIIKIG